VNAISLRQPGPALIVAGAKRVVVRADEPPAGAVGRRIAIHASLDLRDLRLATSEPFAELLEAAVACDALPLVDGALPRGAVVATATLKRYGLITASSVRDLRARMPIEFAADTYRVGAFAWVLADVHRLLEPVACRGRLGVFTIADSVLAFSATAPVRERVAA
jgi:hypothetical protein